MFNLLFKCCVKLFKTYIIFSFRFYEKYNQFYVLQFIPISYIKWVISKNLI